MEFKEHEIPANGIFLHVTELGEGPAVLFCHGFPDTSYTWRRQMTAIASSGYRAIAPDMRGYSPLDWSQSGQGTSNKSSGPSVRMLRECQIAKSLNE
jgi:pimeloyl-ACP methyl ester carboxylesterase